MLKFDINMCLCNEVNMAGKNNANIGFEEQLWKAACVLWGHIPAAEYRKVIVGLIFLRYISSVFDKKYPELLAEGDGFENDKDEYLSENIFFVPKEARWSKISEAAHTPEIGKIIDEAMLAIERENKSLKGVLPKNYGSPDLDKRVLGEVVDLFTNNIKMDDTEESKDLLGRTYEYLFIDARKMGYMADRKHRDFTAADIKKLADTFSEFQEGALEDIKGFCAVVSTEDIAKQDYILTPGRYVGIEEQEDDGEPFEDKMKRLTGELSEMFLKSNDLQEEIKKNLSAIGFEIK